MVNTSHPAATTAMQIGNGILKQTSEMARKLRGTLRFLLGNLNDYNPATQAVPYESLPAIDRYMLFKLGGLMDEIAAAYESFQVSHLDTKHATAAPLYADWQFRAVAGVLEKLTS